VLDTTGLITGCLSYSESPFLFSQFLATASTPWHLVIASGDQGAGCGGLWTGPPWVQLFTATNNEAFVRITYDASIGLFLAGGDAGSVYIGFSPDALVQVWRAPCDPNDKGNPAGLGGFLTAIVPDPYAVGNYFVACQSTANGSFAGRIFEIHSVGPLQFGASEITANLPLAQVMTLASNPNEAGVLYAGTRGQGVFKGVRNATGQWSWQLLNNGMPLAAVVTKLRYDTNSGNVYASTYGRGEFVFITGDVTIF
jgi:hypothetical protein